MVNQSKLDLSLLDAASTQPICLPAIDESQIPVAPGLLEVKEHRRLLYVAYNDHLRSAINQFRKGDVFSIVESNFGAPRIDEITIQYVVGEKCQGVGMRYWERRVISDRHPVFNWPIHNHAA